VILRLTAALILLAACSPTGDIEGTENSNIDEGVEEANDGEAPPDPIEQCDAVDYRHLIGSPVGSATLPDDPSLRVYGENDIITQEYLPRRTNIVYDARRVVQTVYCG